MSNGLRARRSMRVLLAGALATVLVACSGLLDVKNPNDIAESALGNPAAASAMANGVLASTVRMLSGTTVPYSVATDELDWIGSRDAWLELDKGIIGNFLNEFTDQAFPFAGEARFLADATIGRLEAFDAAGTLTARSNLARTYLYAAVVYASIADMYDDYAFSSKTVAAVPIGRTNMFTLYDKAIGYLDKANTIANSANGADLVALRYPIMAYRARVKHAKAVWDIITPKGTTAPAAPLVNGSGATGADADATAAIALGTADEKFLLVNNIEATANINLWFEVNGRNESAIGAAYSTLNDPVSGTLDVTVQTLLAEFSSDGGPAPGPPGSPTDAGTFTITSTRELRLILAESQLAQTNTANFRTQLNIVRSLDGKPNYAGAPIADQQMLAYERKAQLWLMRRRLSDMYRFNIKEPLWVASPTAEIEDSFRFNGLLFPIPQVERLGNPCITNPSC